jgi:uncharacterized protein YggE
VRKEYTYKTPYEQAKAAALKKLIKQANKLAAELGTKEGYPILSFGTTCPNKV